MLLPQTELCYGYFAYVALERFVPVGCLQNVVMTGLGKNRQPFDRRPLEGESQALNQTGH